MKQYAVVYEFYKGEWSAYVPDLPGCTSGGATQTEAAENVKEAITLWIEAQQSQGQPIPEPTTVVGMVPLSA